MTISNWKKIWESPSLITYQNNEIQHLVVRVNKIKGKHQFMWQVTRDDGGKIRYIGERTNKKSAVSLAFEYMSKNIK